jgi:hypothetical protein
VATFATVSPTGHGAGAEGGQRPSPRARPALVRTRTLEGSGAFEQASELMEPPGRPDCAMIPSRRDDIHVSAAVKVTRPAG